MTSENQDSSAKAATVVLGEMIRIAGDDPQARAAASELGKTALTLTKAVNNALLPLAALNFSIESAKRYFASKFQEDMAQKAADIPAEELVEPRPSLAGPALQGLAFSHDEAELREMFLRLLATAMDGRRRGDAHPAFVEVIKQITCEEAQLLGGVLKVKDFLPIGELRKGTKGSSQFEVLARHVLNMQLRDSPIVIPGLQSMVENWIRLGLIEVGYAQALADPSVYKFLESRPEKLDASLPEGSDKELRWQKGVLHVTDFGRMFGRAVGIVEAEQPSATP